VAERRGQFGARCVTWSLQYRTNPLVKEQADSTGNGLPFGVGFTERQDARINQIYHLNKRKGGFTLALAAELI